MNKKMYKMNRKKMRFGKEKVKVRRVEKIVQYGDKIS